MSVPAEVLSEAKPSKGFWGKEDVWVGATITGKRGVENGVEFDGGGGGTIWSACVS